MLVARLRPLLDATGAVAQAPDIHHGIRPHSGVPIGDADRAVRDPLDDRQGGMGRVYRATDPDGEDVALKLAQPDLGRDEPFRRRFDREARVAQRDRPRPPSSRSSTSASTRAALPRPALRRGGSARRSGSTARAACDVPAFVTDGRDVAGGLKAIHAGRPRPPRHQARQHPPRRAGRARSPTSGLRRTRRASALTRPGQAVGSLDYMAPEQIRGQDAARRRRLRRSGCVISRPPVRESRRSRSTAG